MWKQIALVCFSLFLIAGTAEAKKSKGPLPCGDYDGVPSHNDCAPVSADLQTRCQKWIDKGNATDDPKKKNYFKHKYFKCVGYE